MNAGTARKDPFVVTGTFLINNHYASIFLIPEPTKALFEESLNLY